MKIIHFMIHCRSHHSTPIILGFAYVHVSWKQKSDVMLLILAGITSGYILGSTWKQMVKPQFPRFFQINQMTGFCFLFIFAYTLMSLHVIGSIHNHLWFHFSLKISDSKVPVLITNNNNNNKMVLIMRFPLKSLSTWTVYVFPMLVNYRRFFFLYH